MTDINPVRLRTIVIAENGLACRLHRCGVSTLVDVARQLLKVA